jgi:3-oxoacyl-[acyl-carrier-protein] synthase-1
MSRTAHIVALAARTPVGLTAETTAAAIRAGVSRVREHPFMVDADGDPLQCGREPTLEPSHLGAVRLIQLLCRAVAELTTKLGGLLPPAHPLPLLLALPEPRPGFDASAARAIVTAVVHQGMPGVAALEVHPLGNGHAGALLGLQQAVEYIEQGRLDLCMVGGVDGYLQADTIDWLDRDLRLARATRRGGFPPGEGAAIVVLASERARSALRMPSLAIVRAVACTREPRDETAPEGLQGEALTAVYRAVAARLQQPHERIDQLYCDVNDERARTTDLGFALLRAGELFRDGTAYVTSVGHVGDVGAATAPLGCILAARAWARSYAPGPTALVSGASWGGLRGAVLLSQGA